MLEITKHPSLKYFLFGSLYFGEGLIFALSTVIIVLFFNDKNISILYFQNPLEAVASLSQLFL